MRITNFMMSNNTLINISRNMRYLNKITQQVESTKKISVPSDDPIVASRALKFRTNVAETKQFIRNVESGMSWMEVAEAALIDADENLMVRLEALLTEGATGTETYSDKMAIITSIKEMIDQMGLDMNQAYSGRYVFSGYRTNEPPVLIEDDPKMSYRITQNFLIDDIEKLMSYEKYSTTDKAAVTDAHVLKLAYKPEPANADPDTNYPGDFPGIVYDANGNQIPVVVKSLNAVNDNGTPADPSDDICEAYKPPQGTVHYIPETGELVFHPEDAVTTSLFDNPDPAKPDGISVTYDKTGFKKGEINPVVYFPCTDLVENQQYNMDNQEIQYEFATNTYITINSLSKDIYTDKMYADFRRLIEFAESLTVSDRKTLEEYYSQQNPPLTGSDLDKAVTDQISAETALMNEALHDRFNNMLGLLAKHSSNVVERHTQMGSRMLRLDLLKVRLEEDENAYTKLMTENEGTDMEYAVMQKLNAEAAYQMSLRANANIMQLSLANYI